MKIKLTLILVCLSFFLFGQEKFNIEMSTGLLSINYSGTEDYNIIDQDNFDLGFLHGIGISAFLNDKIYLRTEFGTLELNKVLEVERVGSGQTINEFDRFKMNENFFAFSAGVKHPRYGFFGELGIGTMNVGNQEFGDLGSILLPNYNIGLITVGWKRAFFGVDDNLGVMVNAKYIRTLGSIFSVGSSNINQNILSWNIGLHYVFKGSE